MKRRSFVGSVMALLFPFGMDGGEQSREVEEKREQKKENDKRVCVSSKLVQCKKCHYWRLHCIMPYSKDPRVLRGPWAVGNCLRLSPFTSDGFPKTNWTDGCGMGEVYPEWREQFYKWRRLNRKAII